MPILFDGPVTPDAQTTFVRDVPQPPNTRLTQLFPRRENQTNTVDFAEIIRTNRTAKYRTFDGRVHVSQRDAGSEKRVRMLPLSSSLETGELERLQLEFARLQGGNVAALAAAVYNDSENLTNEVLNRVELAFGDLLTDGKLSINEGGLAGYAGGPGEADFGVPTGNLVTATTPWTSTTAPMYSDLLSWCDAYNDLNGFLPGSFLPTLKYMRQLTRCTEIINAVAGAQTGRTRVSRAELTEFLEGEGLPTPLDPFDERLDVDGVSTRVIPEGRIPFFPPNLEDLAHVEYGVTATALELVNSAEVDFSFEDAPGIVGIIDKASSVPFREIVVVDAVAMPILDDARKLMVANVGS